MSKQHTTSPPVTQEREHVEGNCDSCGATELLRYPVNSEGGWHEVVKCQACLYSISREKIGRLGPIVLLSDSIVGAQK